MPSRGVLICGWWAWTRHPGIWRHGLPLADYGRCATCPECRPHPAARQRPRRRISDCGRGGGIRPVVHHTAGRHVRRSAVRRCVCDRGRIPPHPPGSCTTAPLWIAGLATHRSAPHAAASSHRGRPASRPHKTRSAHPRSEHRPPQTLQTSEFLIFQTLSRPCLYPEDCNRIHPTPPPAHPQAEPVLTGPNPKFWSKYGIFWL